MFAAPIFRNEHSRCYVGRVDAVFNEMTKILHMEKLACYMIDNSEQWCT